jgi:RsiW-degrading membrane proteinase PrsW (M82 family)
LANGLLLLAILLNSSLRRRKELIIIAGMAFADVIYGVGAILLGTYRVLILFLRKQDEPSTEWNCLLTAFMVTIGFQLTSVMNVVVSCDRFMAVTWPMKYRNFDGRYAIKVLVSPRFFLGMTELK